MNLFDTTTVNGNNDSFNFDLWVKEVRPQLIAALQKRARRSDK